MGGCEVGWRGHGPHEFTTLSFKTRKNHRHMLLLDDSERPDMIVGMNPTGL